MLDNIYNWSLTRGVAMFSSKFYDHRYRVCHESQALVTITSLTLNFLCRVFTKRIYLTNLILSMFPGYLIDILTINGINPTARHHKSQH